MLPKMGFRTILVILTMLLSACSRDDRGELYFIGDSIIERWDVRCFFPAYSTKNLGIRNTGLSHVLDLCNTMKGKSVVLLTGTNDLSNDATKYDENYPKEYIEAIQGLEAANVYVISILPRCYKKDVKGLNDKIRRLNNDIKNRVENCGWTYIDVFDEFLLDNEINYEYYSDGLHLSEMGYEVLTYYVKMEL